MSRGVRRRQHHLRLGNNRAQFACFRFHQCLPHHRGSPAMERCALADDPSTRRDGTKKIGLRFDRRRACTFRKIYDGGHRTERIGECHHRTAVQDTGVVAHTLPRQHGRGNAFRRDFDKLDSQHSGKRRSQRILKGLCIHLLVHDQETLELYVRPSTRLKLLNGE